MMRSAFFFEQRLNSHFSFGKLNGLFASKSFVRFAVVLWLTFACNNVFFQQLDSSVFIPSVFLLLLINSLIVLLLSPGYMFKPMLILLIFASVSANYFSHHFGTMIDAHMLQNMFETNVSEANDLITWPFVRHLLLFAILPSLLVLLNKPRLQPILKRTLQYSAALTSILILLGGFALLQYQSLSGYFRMHKELRYYATPLNVVSATKRYVKDRLPKGDEAFVTIADEVEFNAFSKKPTVFIVVLGETVRADHLALNGYSRNTNPKLSALPIVNFSQMTSCGTATAHSVPCMFSWMNKQNYDEFAAKHSENVIDIVARAGFDVMWRENDGGCKDVCNRVKTFDVAKSEQCEDGCPDKLLFSSLNELGVKPQNILIVLHQQGSHGPAYFRRSEKANKQFLPECKDETFANCTPQEIINAYDNSLLETDSLLADLINELSSLNNVNAGLLYVSDHGESLGENGVFLHGLPYAFAPKAQTEVPMLVWLSESYQQEAKFDFNCLSHEATKPSSHDALFGSLLGLLSINIQTEKPLIDLVSKCRSQHVMG